MIFDKMIHKAFRTPTNLLTKPIGEIFHFHYLPKLYIGFNLHSGCIIHAFKSFKINTIPIR